MKVLVVGYGSMGRRRVRLIRRLYPDAEFICVDINPERIEQIKADGLIAEDGLQTALQHEPEVAFVCTSPGRVHANLILELIDAGIDTFTELNLSRYKYEDIIKKTEEKNVRVFMSSTMLYDKQIISICEEVKKSSLPVTYIYHVGQYLPDWHPWESYKDFFIGKKETNGCREIFAIQLPWLIKAFGDIRDMHVSSARQTCLHIDFHDSYVVSFAHKNGNQGVFVADVVSRNATTYLEIVGEQLHLFWRGTPDSLMKYDPAERKLIPVVSYEKTEHIDGYADVIIEDEYLDEIQAFFDWLKEDKTPDYTFSDDEKVLKLIDRIEGKE